MSGARRWRWAAVGALAFGVSPALAQQGQSPSPQPQQLQGVTVTARKPRVETLTDRTVYDVKTDLQSKTGTAADVLQNVPSVEVDADGAVTLRGDPNVTILIDGKPSAQLTGSNAGLGLQQLSAADIDRIEVMTNPPARYKADGSAGVINIITRKQRRPGLSGQALANAGDDGRYMAAGTLSYSNGKWTVTAALNVKKDFRRRIITDARTAADPSTGVVEVSRERLDEGLRRLSGQVKGGVDYALTPRTTIGGSFAHQEVQGPRDFSQSDAATLLDATPVNASNRVSLGREWDKYASEEVHLDQGFKRPDETLALSFKRSTSNEREHYADYDTFELPASTPDLQHLSLTQNLATDEVNLEYNRPLAHGVDLRIGYDFEADAYEFHDYGDTETPPGAAPVPNPLTTYDFRYRQKIETGYGELDAAFGRWNLQSGVRAEETHFSTSLDVGGLASAHSYFRAYPSARVEYALTADSKLLVSVARRVNRPNPEALDPFVDYQDIYNLRAGNPDLRPEDIWSYEAGWRYDRKPWSAGVTGYWRFSRDAVTDIVMPVSGNVVLDTKANLPKSKSGGVEITAAGRLLRRLTVNISGNLFYNQIDAEALGIPGLRSTLGVNAKASLDWRPDTADLLQVSLSRSDRRLTPQGSIGALQFLNLGWRRQITPSLAAVVTLSDALNGQRLRRFVETPALNDAYERYQPGQVLWVGLTYVFGGKAGKTDFEYDQ